MIRIRRPILFLLPLIGLTVCLWACSKDTNPAVPPAPEGDVVSVVERDTVVEVGLLSFTPQKQDRKSVV